MDASQTSTSRERQQDILKERLRVARNYNILSLFQEEPDFVEEQGGAVATYRLPDSKKLHKGEVEDVEDGKFWIVDNKTGDHIFLPHDEEGLTVRFREE